MRRIIDAKNSRPPKGICKTPIYSTYQLSPSHLNLKTSYASNKLKTYKKTRPKNYIFEAARMCNEAEKLRPSKYISIVPNK